MIMSIANLVEKETTLLNHDNHRCVNYERNEKFIECCKARLDLLLRDSNLTCTIPGIQSLVTTNSETKECNSKESAGETFETFSTLLFQYGGDKTYLGCPPPCKKTRYFAYFTFRLSQKDLLLKST